MDNPIEEIKKRIDIVDFIGSFVDLKKSGRNYKAICPFHQEKTPSFIVSPERQIWHCFGACGEGGDIIRFLMKWENITFYEALKDLAQKAGVKLKKISYEDRVWKKKQKLIEINNLAAQYYQYVLEKTRFGEKAIDYLLSRGLKKPIIKKFQLGYAPQSWESLAVFLKKKRYAPEEVEETGLLIKGKNSFYDRFRGRIIFPIKNPRGEIVGFSGRLLDPQVEEAKYVNTPETALYHKRETLYGIDLAKEAIKKVGSVYLVEGEFDMISPYQAGVENIVAIKGSAVTHEQLLLLKRYTERVNLFLDADQAGAEAMKRAIEEVESLEFEAGVVMVDFAKDPDEAVRIDPVKFKQIIKKPTPVYDFLLNFFQKRYSLNDAFGKKKIGEEMVYFLEKIKNPIVQSYYIKKVANLLDITESVIFSLIKKLKYRQSRPVLRQGQSSQKEKERGLIIQKYLLSCVFSDDNPYHKADQIIEIIQPSDFFYPVFKKIWQLFLDFRKSHPQKFILSEFVKQLPAETQPVFDEVYLFASHDVLPEKKNIKRLSYELKKISLKKTITEVLSDENELKEEKKEKLKELNKQLKEVEKNLVLL